LLDRERGDGEGFLHQMKLAAFDLSHGSHHLKETANWDSLADLSKLRHGSRRVIGAGAIRMSGSRTGTKVG
jgi:hypothetical protein